MDDDDLTIQMPPHEYLFLTKLINLQREAGIDPETRKALVLRYMLDFVETNPILMATDLLHPAYALLEDLTPSTTGLRPRDRYLRTAACAAVVALRATGKKIKAIEKQVADVLTSHGFPATQAEVSDWRRRPAKGSPDRDQIESIASLLPSQIPPTVEFEDRQPTLEEVVFYWLGHQTKLMRPEKVKARLNIVKHQSG